MTCRRGCGPAGSWALPSRAGSPRPGRSGAAPRARTAPAAGPADMVATDGGMSGDGLKGGGCGQGGGDIVGLASADTDIALLAAAQARRRAADPDAPSLRLAPVMRLGHNFSVDLYMEVAARARLVVARLLGGNAYWPYGVERLVETCRVHRIKLALLPGDDKPDAQLAPLSTVSPAPWPRLWRYLAECGPRDAAHFSRYSPELSGVATRSAA